MRGIELATFRFPANPLYLLSYCHPMCSWMYLSIANVHDHGCPVAFPLDGRWAPEEAAVPASTMDIAMKRLRLTKARLLQSAQAQDRLLQEDRRRAQ